MTTNGWIRHPRVASLAWILGAVGFLLFSIPSLSQTNWPFCVPETCTSQNLKVEGARAWNVTACAGDVRTADIQIYFNVTGVNYNVRIHGKVYDSENTLIATIDTCEASYSSDGWVEIASGVSWNCSRSLRVIDLFVSWQNQAGDYPCGSTLPCNMIDPMCDNTYYSTPLEIAGSEPPNTAPTGGNSSVEMSEDTVYTFSASDFNYSDTDGDPLDKIQITTLEVVGNLGLGVADVALNQEIPASQLSSGNLVYVPAPDTSGSPYDSFRFRVHDGTEYSASDYLMTIHVTPENDPPVAVDDALTTERNTAAAVAVLANDSDPDGDALTIQSLTEPARGTAAIEGAAVQYTPNFLYVGADEFEYTIRDPDGEVSTARVQIDVSDPNHPPIANAGGAYAGVVGDPILLDARFSIDPDIADVLEYRWDVNGDGVWDTGWLLLPTLEYIYDRPYQGPVSLEVQDIYYSFPNGTSDLATTFAWIMPRPTQIAVSVYIDLNGNGEFDDEDVGLPGVSLLLDGQVAVYSEEDGTALWNDLESGLHTIRISDEGIAYLQERGFFLPEDAFEAVELQSGEWVALFFSPEARGFLQVDLGTRED